MSVHMLIHSGPPGRLGTDNVIPVTPAEFDLRADFEPWAIVIRSAYGVTFKNVPPGRITHYTVWRGPELMAAAPIKEPLLLKATQDVPMNARWTLDLTNLSHAA